MIYHWREIRINDLLDSLHDTNDMAAAMKEFDPDYDCVAIVNVGDIAFDIVVREYDGWTLEINMFIGGIDNGYCDINAPHIYADADGLNIPLERIRGLDKDQFKDYCQALILNHIHEERTKWYDVDLVEKAYDTLQIW